MPLLSLRLVVPIDWDTMVNTELVSQPDEPDAVWNVTLTHPCHHANSVSAVLIDDPLIDHLGHDLLKRELGQLLIGLDNLDPLTHPLDATELR